MEKCRDQLAKVSLDDTGLENSPAGEGVVSQKSLKKQAKELEKQRRKEETAARLAAEKVAREAAQIDYSTGKYGLLPVNMSNVDDNSRPSCTWTFISKINSKIEGQTIVLRARVHNLRVAGGKLCFFVLRQQLETFQAVLAVDETNISKAMHKFASSIKNESLVIVQGKVVCPVDPIKSCTVHDAELAITQIHVEAMAPEVLPFTMEDALRPDINKTDGEETTATKDINDQQQQQQFSRVLLDTRLNNRVLDLRTSTNHSIFRIQSGVCQLFREFFAQNDFIEIHTPKLLAAASEGGASVFEVKYFKGRAFLAQSPQFYKQMMVASDFPRVFEFGPVFRAEPSNTYRHMTEYTGVDLEMEINNHYDEALDLFDRLFRYIFGGLVSRYDREIEIIRKQHPCDAFLVDCSKPLLRLRYPQAVEMLRNDGVTMADDEDLSTENERHLGRLVRDRYKTDFFMLEKYPLCCRPFYTMPCPIDPKYSNSYDFFMRGEEIMSGAQRVHDYNMLVSRLRAHGVDPATVQGYLDAFKFGAPPHAGGGIGLERIIMLYLCLNNIRRATLFPRDPSRLEP